MGPFSSLHPEVKALECRGPGTKLFTAATAECKYKNKNILIHTCQDI
jgi:hypothetical protein